MKAKDIRIENIFDINNNDTYKIPVYQRKYSWEIEQVKRLLDDIERAYINNKDHFTGSIICKKINNDLILIDGQQRLITISLILKAISLFDDTYQFNNKKIVACDEDAKAYRAIMTSESFDEINVDDKVKLKENLLYIKERVKNNIDAIKDGIKKLIAVEIILENEDPQEVFESINSLGLKLTPSDLIRNFLLMSLDYKKQENLYNSQWSLMQYEIIGEEYLEAYIYNYIMFKTNEVVRNDDIYKTYVDFANDSNLTHEDLLKELTHYAKLYKMFIKTVDEHKEVCSLMEEIRDMGQTTPYPFLLHVFDDWYYKKIIDEKTLEDIINLIVIYLVRRTVVNNVPSSTLRDYFLKLYDNIFKTVESNKTKENYYKAIYKFMTSSYSKRDKMPSEDEFLDKLKLYHLYTNRKFCNYLLGVIDHRRYNNSPKESVAVDNCSIEHIMPQTLTEEWKEMLGDDYERIHDTYLHTIGNLSLSASSYNSSYSNKSFLEKKELLIKNDSRFNVLNEESLNLDTFGEQQIIDRANRLIEKVKTYYNLKYVDTTDIKFEHVLTAQASNKINRMYLQTSAQSYTFEADKITKYEEEVSNYFDVFRGVINHVYKVYPNEIRKLADEEYKIWKSSKPYFYKGKANKDDYQLDEDLALHINYSNDYLIFSLTSILEKIGLNPEGLIINYKEKKSNFDDIDSMKKKYIVYNALQKLADEGKILDKFDNEKANTSYIKFNTVRLEETFGLNQNITTTIDKNEIKYNAYLEYYVYDKCVYLTIKDIKADQRHINILKDNIDTLNLLPYNGGQYWFIKKYDIDTSKISNDNFIDNFKKIIDDILPSINSDIKRICDVVTKF